MHHLLKANHFCMVSIICKSSFLSGQYAGSSLVFFANQNLSRDREAKLLRKWIALVFHVKFEQRPKYQETDSMVVIITLNSSIDFTKQRSAEKYLANLCFTNNFVNFLESFYSASKKCSDIFEEVDKIHPWRSLILVKLQAFTEAATWGVL